MEKKIVIQKIKKEYSSPLEVAIKYYTILSILNDLKLTERQIQLIAFTAVRGNISSGGRKEEFISLFNSSKASIGNMIFQLGKRGLFQKIEGKTRVHPQIQLDFNNILVVQLQLDNGKKTS